MTVFDDLLEDGLGIVVAWHKDKIVLWGRHDYYRCVWVCPQCLCVNASVYADYDTWSSVEAFMRSDEAARFSLLSWLCCECGRQYTVVTTVETGSVDDVI